MITAEVEKLTVGGMLASKKKARVRMFF